MHLDAVETQAGIANEHKGNNRRLTKVTTLNGDNKPLLGEDMPRAVEDPEDKIATKPPKLSDGVHENGGSNSSLPYAYPMQDNPHAVAIWVAQCIADIGEERKKRNLSEFATAPVPRRARGTKNMAGRLNWLGGEWKTLHCAGIPSLILLQQTEIWR